MERVVDYYLVPQSPFAYLGHPGFAAVLERNGAVPRVKPIDLARVFPLTGGLPLAKRAGERQSYRLLELARFSKRLALPLNAAPRFFPVSGDAASLHIIAATQLVGEDAAMNLVFAFQRAVWAEQRDIADPATIDAIVSACGLDVAAIRASALSAPAKARYEANTDEALATEVFGVPTYVPRFGEATDHRFWGQDRLALLDDALAEG